MALEPTQEQQAACEVFGADQDLALIAGAGTGKTSTLMLMAAGTPKRGLYVAFNRAIADDARRRFGSNVDCRTAHAVAFRAVGWRFKGRLDASARVPAWVTASILGINRQLDIGARKVTVNHQARLVTGMIRRFCYSADRQVLARHMEYVNGLEDEEQEFVARVLLPFAVRAWEDISSPKGQLRFEHDHYMKLWAMGNPVLPADFVLLDEAQDTNPVLEEIFLNQPAQRVCVGDPAQQIYAWRSARDVMTGFPAEQLPLTQSFRFGPQIAAVANRWLRHADSNMQLSGCGPEGSRVGTAAQPDAVLCRSNADAMAEVLKFLDLGVPVALTGGGEALNRIANAALELKEGKRTSHPELFLFASWGEVQEYVERDKSGQDLKAIVSLVDKYGPHQIIDAVNRLSSEDRAQVTVSTAHKAKGREWSSVRIGAGFVAPGVDEDGRPRLLDPAEARLIYVAVTRARQLLDVEKLAWIEDYEKSIVGDARGDDADPRLVELPLTAQLKHPASPVCHFMAEHLPSTVPLVQDLQQRIRALPRPVQPSDVQYPQWWALGHAIDYRLRLSLGSGPGNALTSGIALAGSSEPPRGAPAPEGRAALRAAGAELLKAFDSWLATPGSLGEETLIRLAFVAAYFEDVYRTGTFRRHSMLADASEETTLADLSARVPAYAVEDISQQMQLAEEPFAAFRALPPAARICGPEFSGSADLGGADADFILGGLLLVCKAAREPRRLGREEIYQLAGYLLLDYDNVLGIDRVGLYLSRQGGLVTWGVEDFLRRLGATAPLARLRARFRDHLKDATSLPAAPQSAPPTAADRAIAHVAGSTG
ncbi:UvrD-helicase domain-containing protein [Streptomyces sp. DSM 44917]|uniref:UvrD-helicase domain-containing protein n=1 Tax=Streptomyces boetiae TaxID=3075541 RepID=A0ABU2L6X2_9ACTN|nr:UvrD-helicase domain-containing protein [Streptomyces sp. DSM 44917]MDT0307314.1 UvrD-helicase domain-containing protein [Streptomyces sp. DSM 44917]